MAEQVNKNIRSPVLQNGLEFSLMVKEKQIVKVYLKNYEIPTQIGSVWFALVDSGGSFVGVHSLLAQPTDGITWPFLNRYA